MKTKSQISFIVFFTFVFLIGIVNAAVSDVSSISTINIGSVKTSGSFNVVITTNTTSQATQIKIPSIENTKIRFYYNGQSLNDYNSITLPTNGANTININYTVDQGFIFELEKIYNSTLSVSDGTNNFSKDVKFQKINFCDDGVNHGNLEIYDINIDNQGKGDDNEWERLDNLVLKVEVENNDNDKISDVYVSIKILDNNQKDVTSDFLDDEDDYVKLGTIDEDETDTAEFNLFVDPKLDEGDYKLYVKVYEKNNEDEFCNSKSNELSEDYYEAISVTADREVAYTDLIIPALVSCGSTESISFTFYNFGLGDDEEMRVSLYNSELKIDSVSDKFKLDEGKKEDLIFDFIVPKNSTEKTYKLKVITEYDYKESSETFKKTTNDAGEIILNVKGNCGTSGVLGLKPTLNTELETKAISGEEMVVKATISNSVESGNYKISAEGYESWAELTQIDPEIVQVNKGASKEVLIKFKLKSDALGDKTFNVVVSDLNNNILTTQSLGVNVEKSNAINFSNLTKNFDWKVGLIVLLNLVLIVAIIIVAKKVLKKK